jgi:hypothetical protein
MTTQERALSPQFAKQVRWGGRPLVSTVAQLDTVGDRLPVFDRIPMGIGLEENPYKDLIVQQKPNGHPGVPVVAVEKSYRLVQHRDTWEAMREAVRELGLPQDIPASLAMAEFGERMCLTIEIPGHTVDPGDGAELTLRISAMNSVDMSTSIGLSVEWFRWICANGMAFGLTQAGFRRAHTGDVSAARIIQSVRDALHAIPDEAGYLKSLLRQPLPGPGKVSHWLNRVVSKKWDRGFAIRAHHILASGQDGEVIRTRTAKDAWIALPGDDVLTMDDDAKMPVEEQPFLELDPVPGAHAPVQNLYHAAQALSWLAGTATSVQTRIRRLNDIPGLIDALRN